MTTKDPEGQFLREIAKIDDLKERIESLEEKVETITDKADAIDVLGFQNQIFAIDKKVKSLEERLLRAIRYFAAFEVESLRITLIRWIRDAFGVQSPIYIRAREHLLLTAAKARQQILHSENPIPIAQKVRGDWRAYCQDHGIDAFFSE